MFNFSAKCTVVAFALVALPGVANAAGSTGGTGSSALIVNNVGCSITGTSVDLGTFTSSDTWQTVGDALGKFTGGVYTAGSRGQRYVNFGSITCDNLLGYTFTIQGTATAAGGAGAIKITTNGKTALLYPGVKTVGATVLADVLANFVGFGVPLANPIRAVSATGTGAVQQVLGSVVVSPGNSTENTAVFTDKLAAGTFSDQLRYAINF
jgi:hypothetical protein